MTSMSYDWIFFFWSVFFVFNFVRLCCILQYSGFFYVLPTSCLRHLFLVSPLQSGALRFLSKIKMCAQIEYIILAYGGYKLEKKMMRGRKVYYQNNLVIGTKLLNYALQLVLDYDDLMRIPVVNDVIRKSVDEAVKVRYVSTFSCQHACSHIWTYFNFCEFMLTIYT